MLKKISIITVLIFLGFISLFFYFDEPLPNGIKGSEVELLTDKMLNAIEFEAWQNTEIVSWVFPGGHLHTWDKKRHLSQVEWDDYKVLFQIDSLKGIAYENGQRVPDNNAKELIEEAWKHWANDSFWLNAPAKIRDGGTERKLVSLENGEKGILVIYQGGGVTPGDQYLWVLNKDYSPKYCKMWVSIIPIGGVKFTWENWKVLDTGAKIAQNHNGIISVDLKNIKAANTAENLFPEGNPFDELIAYLNN